jgi:hypothetical protein
MIKLEVVPESRIVESICCAMHAISSKDGVSDSCSSGSSSIMVHARFLYSLAAALVAEEDDEVVDAGVSLLLAAAAISDFLLGFLSLSLSLFLIPP